MKKCILLILVLAACSCSDDPVSSKKDVNLSLSGAFITNEGNFGSSNGSLSFYDLESKTVQNNIFENVNGHSLGDVINSINVIDSLAFIVVNNSNKVEVIRISNWQSKATIALPGSPRYIVKAGESKAYVTNWFSDDVSIIDLNSLTNTGSISVGNTPEQIAVSNNYAFVANSGFGTGKTISVINILSDQVVNTISVGFYPSEIATDNEGMLHVLCAGFKDWSNSENNITGGIYKIDPLNFQVVDSLKMDGLYERFKQNLHIDDHNTGYFSLNDAIVSYNTTTMNVIDSAYFSIYHYGFNLDKESNRFFMLDDFGFVQDGQLKIYNSSKVLEETHSLKIGPGYVAFIYSIKEN